MRMQSSQANCGSTSLYNALHALGYTSATLEECEKACKVDATEGTSVKKMLAGIKTMGKQAFAEIKEAKDDIALLKLDQNLRWGMPALLVVDADSHWVTVIGRLGEHRYLLCDPADSELVISLSEGELLQRWGTPGARKPYYAVVVR